MKIDKKVQQDLVSFVQDLLGPVFEASELLSDKIRFVRFKSAMRVLEKAKTIIDASDVKTQHIPIKFLVPFLENCSLEEESSSLIDMWARLLASASHDYDYQHNVFSDILSRIGPYEAGFLKAMWENVKKKDYSKYQSVRDSHIVYKAMKDMHIWESENDALTDLDFFRVNETITLDAEDKRSLENYRWTTVMVLERENLIQIKAKELRETKEHHGYIGIGAKLTPLGFEFVSCVEAPSNDVPPHDSGLSANT